MEGEIRPRTIDEEVGLHMRKTGLPFKEAWINLYGPLRCSKCDAVHSEWYKNRPRSYCPTCRNKASNEWKKKNPLTGEQKRKAIARTYSHIYRDRGFIQREACSECGAHNAEMHHPDYSKPLEVVWLCRACHRELHRRESAA